MILKQYYLGCLAHASYLLGDEASSTAIIVDPQRDIQQYVADAGKFKLQIRHVFLTHFHADFVAGHLELRDLVARKAQGAPDAAPNNGGTHPSSRDSAATICAGSSEAQGPPDAAPNNGGTHPSSRDSAARTCAGSLAAQGPPDAAPNNGGTHPSSRDSAARTCAGSSEEPATIHLGSRAQAEYAFVAMKDGDSLEFPGLRLEVLETPGHTIESISILVFDLRKDPAKPYAVLTGDTMFIGDVGRPDLRASLGWSANDLGAHLYHSLHDKLLALPDETLVYPAHGAGSLCGKQLSSDTVSSLGVQRRLNYALQPMSKEAFIRLVTADQPDAPPYFTFDAILNTRERATLDSNLEQVLHPIGLDEVLLMGDAGAQILDIRDSAEYAKGHLAGSINIGLGGQYATWAGTVLDRTRPIVIIAEPGREREAALRLGRIGFDHVKGYMNGGMEALARRPDMVWPTERISAPMVAEELATSDPPLLLDIRNPREWVAKHIDGSVNIPLNHLQERIGEIPRDRRIALHCAGGYRSSIAAGILHQYGITRLIEMAGGLAAWEAAKLPVVFEGQPDAS